MKTNLTLKKSLVLGAVLVALGAGTAFAGTNQVGNENYPGYNKNSKNMQQQKFKGQKSFRQDHVRPVQTLAKLSNKDVAEIRSECAKDGLTHYEFAKKQGVLNKFKAERMLIAKERVNTAIKSERISKADGEKILARIQNNISQEKPERLSLRGDTKMGGKGFHGKNRQHNQNSETGKRGPGAQGSNCVYMNNSK